MDFDAALAYMNTLRRHGIKLGNERVAALLARLGDPHRAYGVVHVAGTKGKGSTTAMAASILTAHGFRTGGYYSPYVYDVTERVTVDGEPITRADLAALITEIRPHVEALAATDAGQTTEFEMKTAVGFLHFARAGADYAAVEVGIGGRLDATNVVAPLACVITNIGLDHTHILGDTIAQIASEKAGIIKPGVPVVTAAGHPDALEVIANTAHERGAALTVVQECSEPGVPPDGQAWWHGAGSDFTVRTTRGEYRGLATRLEGAYQRANAACAVAVLEPVSQAGGFTLGEEAVRAGLSTAWLPGRFQVARRRPTVVLDGAHNGLAARALAAELERLRHRRLLLVIGVIAGHDPAEILAELAPTAHCVYATRPTWRRGLPAEEVAHAARRYCARVVMVEPPLEAARAAVADAGEEDLVLITGSFYTVGDVSPEAL